jgi:hypothetical protein
MRSRWAGGVVLGIAALVAPPARGQDRPQVSVDVHLDEGPCAITDREGLLRVVRVELGPAVAAGEGGADGASTTRVTVTCEADLIRLRVDDPVTGMPARLSSPISRSGTRQSIFPVLRSWQLSRPQGGLMPG